MHATSDLEACYDRKIQELCEIVEESIGSNLKVIKLLKKMLPRFEHHLGTANGVNTDKHRGKNELLGGIGQGNMF